MLVTSRPEQAGLGEYDAFMEIRAAAATHGDDALAQAALVLLNEGATAAELVERFGALGAVVQPLRVARLVERLVALGPIRAAATPHDQPYYVLTSLGRQFASRSLAAQPDVAARLEEVERLRTDLLATIAHELRTPLTAVRTCVGLLLDPTTSPDPSTHEQLLQAIARNADRMQRLVTDVLDLARFRAGRIPLQLRRFDARRLARDTAAAMEPLLHERGQQLDLLLPKSPVWVYGDCRRLERALLNLLSNAHKFSPDGARVRLAVAQSNDDITWSVSDEGPGIAPEDRPRLFERFYTTPGPAAGGKAGVGLGLPIALAIAQAHGGAIMVETAAPTGSTLTIRVPARGPVEAEDP
jgi:signal transduction histidine kinase